MFIVKVVWWICMYAHTHTQAFTYTHTHVSHHTRMQVYMHAYKHIYTHMNTLLISSHLISLCSSIPSHISQLWVLVASLRWTHTQKTHMVTPQPFVWMFIDMHQMMWSTNNKVKWNISFPSSGNSNHQLSQELFFVSLMMFADSEQLLFYSLTIPVAATQHLNQMY